MQIELNKNYIRNNGTATTIVRMNRDSIYPFVDAEGNTYSVTGRYQTPEYSTSDMDLVREYRPEEGDFIVMVPRSSNSSISAVVYVRDTDTHELL